MANISEVHKIFNGDGKDQPQQQPRMPVSRPKVNNAIIKRGGMMPRGR